MSFVTLLAEGASWTPPAIDTATIVSNLQAAMTTVLPAAVTILGVRKVGSFIMGILRSA